MRSSASARSSACGLASAALFSAGGFLFAAVGCAPPAPASAALELAAGPGSLAPNLDLGADGRARLSWIEPLAEGGHALCFSTWDGEHWSAAQEIARGTDWIVNWADVPALAALSDGTLAAAWLAQLGSDPQAYGIQVSLSTDGGATWIPPRALHTDASASEHGFVSLEPFDADTFGAVWLDGRAVAASGQVAGATQLLGRTLRRDGTSGFEQLLDERVCDCCPTALVRVGGRTLAAYRDRGDDELRDIKLITLGPQGLVARSLSDDGWRIDGCPVNGPALDVRGQVVGAAWYTEGGGEARVCCALSRDGGATFDEPVVLSSSTPIGSVDAAFGPGGELWVSWLQAFEDGRGAWKVARVEEDGTLGSVRELATVPPSRTAGIARLVALSGELLFAWTEVGEDGSTRVRSARWALEG
jgi:hypothetical protein